MSDVVVVDKEALEELKLQIINYFKVSNEMFDEAKRKINFQSDEWNDEDYSRLSSAIKFFLTRFEEMNENSKTLISALDGKIKQIEILNNKKI